MANDISELVFHSSRSRYECFQRCDRKGFLQYCYMGTGIVRKGKNIYLSTGIFTHRGFALILKWAAKHKKVPGEDMLSWFVQKTVNSYKEYVFPEEETTLSLNYAGFDISQETIDEWTALPREQTILERARIQQYILDEQCALVEAFMRLLVLRVLPRWLEIYNIVTVENDMAFDFVDGVHKEIAFKVIQSATIDVVFQHKTSKDIVLVSFKTAGRYDNRTKSSGDHDTQGLSETWAFEKYLTSKGSGRPVMGIQMLYMIKGARSETSKGSGMWETKSPLIKGYKKIGLSEIEYAHSWWIPKPQNKSGWGIIGQGWESFNVWEDHDIGGVKGWLELLANGDIQPECGDILADSLVAPLMFDRARISQDVASWHIQTIYEEVRLVERIIDGAAMATNDGDLQLALDANFPQVRSSCDYPSACTYQSICFGTPEQRWNPMASGEWEAREPHHKAELIQIKGK